MGASRVGGAAETTLAEKVCTERPKEKQTCRSEMQVDGPAHEATARIRGMRTPLGQRREGEAPFNQSDALNKLNQRVSRGEVSYAMKILQIRHRNREKACQPQINVRKRTQATEPEKQKEGKHPAVLNVARATTHLPCLNALTPACGLNRFETHNMGRKLREFEAASSERYQHTHPPNPPPNPRNHSKDAK